MAADAMIVGAGPTGLTAALGLAERGLSVRMVDEGEGPSEYSKAFVIHARTLECLHPLGVAEPIAEEAHTVDGGTIFSEGRTIARIDVREVESPFSGVHVLPQASTERILLDAVEQKPSIDLQWETEVVDIATEGDEVVVDFDDGSSDRAAWGLGCDGGHSTVRDRVGASFEGEAIPGTFGLGDVQLSGDMPKSRLCAFLSGDGVTGCIYYGSESRFRVITTVPEDRTDVDRALLQEALDDRTHFDTTIESVDWTSCFSIQQRRTQNYRHGRVFLAGDAAHVHSPAGGQGMNTGMQDALNLAWKIGRVASGHAAETLLDSYDDERIPVAEELLRGTGFTTKFATSDNPVVKSVRNRLASFLTSIDAIHRRLVQNVAMLRVGYPESPIVGESTDSIWTADVLSDDSTEAASVAERWSFERGALPGSRMPPGPVSGIEGASDLYDLLSYRRFLLLLFDGRAHTEEGYRRLETIRRSAAAREDMRPVVVASRDDRPDAIDSDADVCLDGDFALHDRFSADAECLYLVRPDAYIGYRQQPPDFTALEDFLGGGALGA